ncbi:MAG: hypothetical protein M3Y24_11640 [Acidobacteriota bacterium]|nr:hypothetical protein [Acidobacteriota bacterium]
MKAAALVFLLAPALFATTPRLIYSRSFPGSSPEFFRVTISQIGALEYSESPVDDKPLKAQLSPSETAPLFEMADKLDRFKTPLESGLKVANTGKKTFRYEDGNGGNSEAVFNYSIDPTAQHLLEKMEQIAATERSYLSLDSSIRFDKLGVNDSLAEIESLWLRKQLAAPSQFIPLLDRVISHPSFMHIARDRAARLKDEFSKPVIAPANESRQNAEN